MSRILVIPITMRRDNYQPDPPGVALNPGAGNGHRVNSSVDTNAHLIDSDRTVLRIIGGTTGGTVTVRFADNTGSSRKDLVVPVAAGATAWAGPFASASFDNGGQLLVDVAAMSSDGTLTAFSMTRG